MQPLLVRTLQHNEESVRSEAARTISVSLAQLNSPQVAASFLTCSEDVLGLLLKLLASDDEAEAKAAYAMLLGTLSLHADADGLKSIADAGAVPYVLQLLKQATDDYVKDSCVRCLQVSHSWHVP